MNTTCHDEHDEEPPQPTLWELFLCFVFMRPGATVCAVVFGCSVLYAAYGAWMMWGPK